MLCAVLAAGNASALHARRFIDADHRTQVTLPGDQGGVAAIRNAPQLLADDHGKPVSAMAPASEVPEPSATMLLCCGLLLLSLAPAGHRSAVFDLGARKVRRRADSL
jgi:hypothetical protein